MAVKIFIASTERGSGKSLITIGLMSALQGIIPRVGYMKPVGQRYQPGGEHDEDAYLVKSIFDLSDEVKHINPMSLTQAQQNKDALFDHIFESFRIIAEDKDAVFIEGTDYTSAVSALEFDINADIAQNLVAPVLLVTPGYEKSVDEILHNATEYAESFIEHGCTLLGVVVNRFVSDQPKEEERKLSEGFEKHNIQLFGIIYNDPVLSGPRLAQVVESLGAEVLIRGDNLNRVVTDTKILAMTPENALEYIKDRDGYLIITPGDRSEHIFTVLSAHKSRYFPEYSGIILTGGLRPGNNVRILIEGIADAGLTVLSVKDDTFVTALKVNQITGELSKDDDEKISLVRQSVQWNVDIRRIHDLLGSVETDVVTPRMFQYRILEMAKKAKSRIVLPEGTEPRILRAALEIQRREVCDVIILGNREAIMDVARGEAINTDESTIFDHLKDKPERLEEYAQILYELRKHKGVTLARSRDSVLDPIVYAALMVYRGDADGYVSGSTHSTADTLRPVLQLIRTKPDVSLASSVFFMCMPEQVLVYGDCALVANPSAEELADIAITSSETASAFGITPVVAMLSYSTGESGKGEDVDKVRKATQIASKRRPDILIEGPLQYDAAISPEVAMLKYKDSKVAGKATVYIFPDLDAGNTAYKAVQRTANVPAIGPVLQGLNKPANDLSRGATVTDIVYTIAITAIQAQPVTQ